MFTVIEIYKKVSNIILLSWPFMHISRENRSPICMKIITTQLWIISSLTLKGKDHNNFLKEGKKKQDKVLFCVTFENDFFLLP